MNNWWRWVLRGLAVVALAVGAVLLFAQPTASETLRVSGSSNPVTIGCSSPFEQFQGNVFWTSQPLQPTTETRLSRHLLNFGGGHSLFRPLGDRS